VARAVGRSRPLALGVVPHLADPGAGGVSQGNAPSLVVELPLERPQDPARGGVALPQGGGVGRNHQILPRVDEGPRGKAKADFPLEPPFREVRPRRLTAVDFHELGVLARKRVVVDLGDADPGSGAEIRREAQPEEDRPGRQKAGAPPGRMHAASP